MFTTKCIHLVKPVQKNILKKINLTLEENTKQMMIVNPFQPVNIIYQMAL